MITRDFEVEEDGSEMIPWTVASTLPLIPYAGDQMSSSISRISVMAKSDGTSNAAERVFVKAAVGCIERCYNSVLGNEVTTNFRVAGEVFVCKESKSFCPFFNFPSCNSF